MASHGKPWLTMASHGQAMADMAAKRPERNDLSETSTTVPERSNLSKAPLPPHTTPSSTLAMHQLFMRFACVRRITELFMRCTWAYSITSL